MEDLKSILSSEEVEKHAKALLDSFMPKLESELFHKFYDEINKYLYEHHLNFQERIVHEVFSFICGSEWNRFSKSIDGRKLRSKLFEEHREEIIKDLPKDIVMENDELKQEVERLKQMVDQLHRFN